MIQCGSWAKANPSAKFWMYSETSKVCQAGTFTDLVETDDMRIGIPAMRPANMTAIVIATKGENSDAALERA